MDSERRITASHPDYPALNELAQMIAWATNPHLLTGLQMDLPDAEQRAVLATLHNRMAEKLEGGVWADFINAMEAPHDLYL